MKTIFTYSIHDDDKIQIINLFTLHKSIYINQYPGWQDIIFPNKKICCFLQKNVKNELTCYAFISEHLGIATINFGPIGLTSEYIIEGILEIEKYYKKNKFIVLTIQLGTPTNQDTERIQYLTYSKKKFSLTFSNKNWSTLLIDLSKDINSIKKDFSKGHKYDISRADDLIEVKILSTKTDIDFLAKIYDEMYLNRHIRKTFNKTTDVFNNIYNFFTQNKNGYFIGVFLKAEAKLIGGIILIKQGNTLLYQYGATNFAYRHLPILHKAIFEGIKIGQQTNCTYIDLGGYNYLVTSDDQIFNINKFKKGFGGVGVFYPAQMTFRLNKIVLYIYTILPLRKIANIISPIYKLIKHKL